MPPVPLVPPVAMVPPEPATPSPPTSRTSLRNPFHPIRSRRQLPNHKVLSASTRRCHQRPHRPRRPRRCVHPSRVNRQPPADLATQPASTRATPTAATCPPNPLPAAPPPTAADGRATRTHASGTPRVAAHVRNPARARPSAAAESSAGAGSSAAADKTAIPTAADKTAVATRRDGRLVIQRIERAARSATQSKEQSDGQSQSFEVRFHDHGLCQSRQHYGMAQSYFRGNGVTVRGASHHIPQWSDFPLA
jgi:cytoskeletal protein RodZ